MQGLKPPDGVESRTGMKQKASELEDKQKRPEEERQEVTAEWRLRGQRARPQKVQAEGRKVGKGFKGIVVGNIPNLVRETRQNV